MSNAPHRKQEKRWTRFVPLITILGLMATAYFTGLTDQLTFENLKMHRQFLQRWIIDYPFYTPLSFIVLYAIATALSIPGGLFLSLFAGFLFAQPFSTIYVVIGATIGATAIFLAAKTALGDTLKKRAGPLMKKMHAGFEENAISYLFFLRLIPLFPFWLVNLAPAFFGVPLRTYLWTTFLGIIPGTFVFTQAGTGLGAILDSEEAFAINTIFNNDIKIALVALAAFSLLPILYKRFKKGKPS